MDGPEAFGPGAALECRPVFAIRSNALQGHILNVVNDAFLSQPRGQPILRRRDLTVGRNGKHPTRRRQPVHVLKIAELKALLQMCHNGSTDHHVE